MTASAFKYIYGPVYSWRLGMSLGVDPLNTERKYCNFACSYCQLGAANSFGVERKVFVSVEDIVSELKGLPADVCIDYVTFSGNGEPTLAANLGAMIRAVHSGFAFKTAVITNSSTIQDAAVRLDLAEADFVLFKLEAADQKTFEAVNVPCPGITLEKIVAGLVDFRKTFKGRMALQIMMTEANKDSAAEIARMARRIAPDEVQLNTPLRPSPVKPLDEGQMFLIKRAFSGLKVLSVYEEEKRRYEPFDDAATRKRHGQYRQ
jgi:wyosine [tRNA(Phe)-imidazoG37] synthetase (radical SAM superfamily)